VSSSLSKTPEKPSIASPDYREWEYGQSEQVRIYVKKIINEGLKKLDFQLNCLLLQRNMEKSNLTNLF
jgi:hypothetical protein